jgi:3-methyladenine DNA glycosylase AlkC
MKHKDHYDDQYILQLSLKLSSVIPEFDQKTFTNDLIGKLDDKELFARFDYIVDTMEKCMANDFSRNIQSFFNILGPELTKPEGMFQFGWWLWPIGRYVERHGNENWQLSLSFLKELTKRFTGEYAIRSLLKEHPKEVMDELILWTNNENVHVRRLASEGVRIHLPWAQKLFVALEEFERYSAILTNLKDDPERFVQKSVGNNINDLFKEAPDKADYIIAQWKKTTPSKAQEWIIKHGMRNQSKMERCD